MYSVVAVSQSPVPCVIQSAAFALSNLARDKQTHQSVFPWNFNISLLATRSFVARSALHSLYVVCVAKLYICFRVVNVFV